MTYNKRYHLFSSIAITTILFMFSACSSEDFPGCPDHAEQANTPFTIQIESAVFNSQYGTRANNTNQPYTTTFSSGDIAGLIAVDRSGNPVDECDNIRLAYSSSGWKFADAEFTAYYNPDYTYIAYFPYSNKASGLSSIEDIRQTFPPALDQDIFARYNESDIIAAEGKWDSETKTLRFDMDHLHTLLTLPGNYETRYTFRSQEGRFLTPVLQASVTAGGKVYKTQHWTYNGLDQYRVILPSSTEECELTARLKVKSQDGHEEQLRTLSATIVLTANQYYEWQPEELDLKDYAASGFMRMGDYLCRTKNGEDWYIVPQEMTLADDDQCFGIVFYSGFYRGEEDPDEISSYSSVNFKDGNFHGYAVALTDVGQLQWGPYGETAGVSTDRYDWKGYSNQKKLEENIDKYPAAKGCQAYGSDDSGGYAAPTNTSGWFLPSCGQLSYLYSNRTLLSNQMNKCKEKLLDDNIAWFKTSWYYWSSSERSGDRAWRVLFDDGGVGDNLKDDSYDVRAVLAF